MTNDEKAAVIEERLHQVYNDATVLRKDLFPTMARAIVSVIGRLEDERDGTDLQPDGRGASGPIGAPGRGAIVGGHAGVR